MFYIKEPSVKKSPWILSHHKDEKVASIPADTLKDTKNYQILGVDFLYQNYKKQFKGAILNMEEGMNMQFQVATFLNSMLNYVETKFLVLVLVPDHSIVNWHYHLSTHGGLKVQLITPKTCPEDFDQEHGLALILSFSNIKLSEYLIDYDYFSVIIDDFDEVASKLIIRKLHGYFNIGLTQRNFYSSPDQKLQWTMLNWSNPGCVGKLGEFYEIDNDNFANFRDNYRHWWFRLTWNFCNTFKKPTEKEKQEYIKTLSKWSDSHHLKAFPSTKPEKAKKKRKPMEIIGDDHEQETIRKKKTKTMSTSVKNRSEINEKITVEFKENAVDGEKERGQKSAETNSQSSEDTLIYEIPKIEKERGPNYVELPSMDENPILNSIIRTLETSPEPIVTQHSTVTFAPDKYNTDEPNCSKALEEDDILLSIIDSKSPVSPALEEELALSYKKEELRSQIFNEDPCTSISSVHDNSADTAFFQSLIDPDTSVKPKRSETIMVRCRSEDIDTILRETEVLLKQ